MNVVPFVGRTSPALETLTGELQAMVSAARYLSKQAVHFAQWSAAAESVGQLETYRKYRAQSRLSRRRANRHLDWARLRQAEIQELKNA